MRILLFIVAIILYIAFASPALAQATVVINEVAWMGSMVGGKANANAEWIELFNSGSSSIDLTGWRLVATSGSPSINLIGSISANGFFLLKRKTKATISGVTADQEQYIGALVNSGTTLILKNASGAIVNQVDGGANWVNIGGDNVTKHTAQRTTSGWTTAAPTPRAINVGVTAPPASPPNEPTPGPATATETTSAVVPTGGPPPEYIPIPSLRISAGSNRIVSVGADTAFKARVYDEKGRNRDGVIITWSFGDGMQRTGGQVYHAYHNAGEYVVVVRAVTQDGAEALAEFIVTAKDARIEITSLSARGITITNNTSRTVDLSLWRLSMGGNEFRIPAGTHVLSKRSVTFPAQVIRLPLAGTAALMYPSGEAAFVYPPAITSAPESVASVIERPSKPVARYERSQGAGASAAPARRIEPVVSQEVNSPRYKKPANAPATDGMASVAGAAAAISQLRESQQVETTEPSGFFDSPWTLGGLAGILMLAASIFIFS